MKELYAALLELQNLDNEIAQAELRVAEFKPRIDELRAPVTALEKEAEQTRVRLEETRAQQKKLELGAENKREKLRVFEERVQKSRNIRDEAATRTEMDLIRRAVEAEVAEEQETAEQVKRVDMRLDEVQRALAKSREEIEPKQQEVEAERDEVVTQLKILQDKRTTHASHIDKQAVRLYERVRSGKRKSSLAPLTVDGACGNCYNVLPPQEQSEIRMGSALRRCEACGIILYPVN